MEARNSGNNPRHELISLLRGFIAAPVIASLEELGVISFMLKGPFSSSDLAQIPSSHYRNAVLDYLNALDLIELVDSGDENYELTKLGISILKRSGTAQIMYSYRDMLASLSQILSNESFDIPECDRGMNVRGSGKTHGEKFFAAAIERMADWELETLIDLSAGDGGFLTRAIGRLGVKNILVNDLSPIAVQIASHSVANNSPEGVNIAECVGDARDILRWSQRATSFEHGHNESLGVALWFLLHEIAQTERRVEDVRTFLQEIKEALPRARLVIGEIFFVDGFEIKSGRHESILPEFFFFHHFSGQAVLSQNELEESFNNAGYSVDFFIGVDRLPSGRFSSGVYGLSPESS